MLDRLRTPFFIIAAACLLLALLIETGTGLFGWFSGEGMDRPGLGIGYLALIDGLLLYRVAIMALALFRVERAVSKIQGIATIIVAILAVLGGILMALAALALLLLMLALLLSIPFGTVVYMALYGGFNKGGAAVTLGTLLTLKIAFALFLVLAHQRFLQNKGLVLLTLTAIVCNIIVAFLHGLVPRPLVSITDAVGAIVLAIIGVVWALIMGIFSIPAAIRALRVDRWVS
jgi:hypothetical protein